MNLTAEKVQVRHPGGVRTSPGLGYEPDGLGGLGEPAQSVGGVAALRKGLRLRDYRRRRSRQSSVFLPFEKLLNVVH